MFLNSKFSLSTIFSRNILISHYTHIGFKKKFTNQSFRDCLLGFYSEISIIDPSYTLFTLKLASNFLFSLLLQNLRVCFSFFDFPKKIKRLPFFGNYFIFNLWLPGLISNYSVVAPSKKIKNSNSFFPYIPSAVFIFGASAQKAYNITLETNSLLIPTFVVMDSNFDPTLFSYFIPSNTKSAFSKIFFLNFASLLSSKSYIIKRKLFFEAVIKKKKQLLRQNAQLREEIKKFTAL